MCRAWRQLHLVLRLIVGWHVCVRLCLVACVGGARYFQDYHAIGSGWPNEVAKTLPTVPCTFTFEGAECMCVKDNDYLMTLEYGADWRIPKAGFKSEDLDRSHLNQ